MYELFQALIPIEAAVVVPRIQNEPQSTPIQADNTETSNSPEDSSRSIPATQSEATPEPESYNVDSSLSFQNLDHNSPSSSVSRSYYDDTHHKDFDV
ncbi:hypothetical protein E3N88_22702 [Mikania micrantha]|uniref:Uncharacterized protein n=1 Tax=Mikania micrantha TaxID=192012 RepID=A0A5N6NB77_9ASTR|nr:hypothetical protein E3N88_22702 [Mikania micrantha]